MDAVCPESATQGCRADVHCIGDFFRAQSQQITVKQ
jgi:hypothetical protein